MRKPTVPKVLPIAQEYYNDRPAGGAFHIYLADGNTRKDCIEFCLRQARLEDDLEGVRLGELLLQMSNPQRVKIYRSLSH